MMKRSQIPPAQTREWVVKLLQPYRDLLAYWDSFQTQAGLSPEMSPQLPSLLSGAVAVAVVMEDPVAAVVRCDLTLRKQSLRVRRRLLPSAKVVRVEPGSEAQQVQQDQQQLLLVLVVTRLMEVLEEPVGKVQRVELEV